MADQIYVLLSIEILLELINIVISPNKRIGRNFELKGFSILRVCFISSTYVYLAMDEKIGIVPNSGIEVLISVLRCPNRKILIRYWKANKI